VPTETILVTTGSGFVGSNFSVGKLSRPLANILRPVTIRTMGAMTRFVRISGNPSGWNRSMEEPRFDHLHDLGAEYGRWNGVAITRIPG